MQVSTLYTTLYSRFDFGIGGSSNGRTAPFEGVYRGPNPCPPAMDNFGWWLTLLSGTSGIIGCLAALLNKFFPKSIFVWIAVTGGLLCAILGTIGWLISPSDNFYKNFFDTHPQLHLTGATFEYYLPSSNIPINDKYDNPEVDLAKIGRIVPYVWFRNDGNINIGVDFPSMTVKASDGTSSTYNSISQPSNLVIPPSTSAFMPTQDFDPGKLLKKLQQDPSFSFSFTPNGTYYLESNPDQVNQFNEFIWCRNLLNSPHSFELACSVSSK